MIVLSVFLTDLDTRAAVKGSRDPLGIQSVWTRFGRHVVGNLTTVSTSVRDFTITIVGYYLVDRLRERLGTDRDLATFLKWEQLAAYARGAINEDWQFRGTEKARRNLEDGRGRVRLSEAAQDQILGNQKIYGLWGLYTAPSRASGLLLNDPVRLAPPALELVEKSYLRAFGERGIETLLDLLAKDRPEVHIDGRHEALVRSIASLLEPNYTAQERHFYRQHLVLGGPSDQTGGLQSKLASLMQPLLGTLEPRWFYTIQQLIRDASAQGEAFDPLAVRLARIRTVETVLAPSSFMFSYLLGCDGLGVDRVASRLEDAWGERVPGIDPDAIEELVPELNAALGDSGERWLHLAQALSAGQYQNAVKLLVHQNQAVMAARGSAAGWVDLTDNRLRVRFRDDAGTLPSREELNDLWRFPYFIDSLWTVALTLEAN